jgi:hypothetical protein
VANRSFTNEGFWDRVDEAIKDSGMTKIQLAEKLGINRKALYVTSCPKGKESSWHSGRIKDFCQITGVSADWLLGLSDVKTVKLPKDSRITFRVIDKRTGKEPVYDGNHIFMEKWFKDSNLIYCDLDSWCISEDGYLILTDDCGNVGYPPSDRFEVVFD